MLCLKNLSLCKEVKRSTELGPKSVLKILPRKFCEYIQKGLNYKRFFSESRPELATSFLYEPFLIKCRTASICPPFPRKKKRTFNILLPPDWRCQGIYKKEMPARGYQVRPNGEKQGAKAQAKDAIFPKAFVNL